MATFLEWLNSDITWEEILGLPKVNSSQKDLPGQSSTPLGKSGNTVVPEKENSQVPTKVTAPSKMEQTQPEYEPREKIREVRKLLRKYQKEAKKMNVTLKPPSK